MRAPPLAMLTTAAAVAAAATVATSSPLSILTWNIAAINNNPFEYWLKHEDPKYNELMSNVQAFMASTAEDVPIETVFTQEKYNELATLMHREMKVPQPVLDKVFAERWQVLKRKPIISGFLKDAEIGKKRFASMPDRQTNTLGNARYRPTAINCYPGNFASFEDWWAQWKRFMFEDSDPACKLLRVIPRSKYPELTEEDEALSLPLQTISLAVFDSILIHMLNKVGANWWQDLRREICSALNLKKNERISQILTSPFYAQTEVVLLQEVSVEYLAVLQREFAAKYWVTSVPKPTRDQNSVILLSKQRFQTAPALVDVLADGQEQQRLDKVENGDLVAVRVDDLLVASFHGDTDGLATIPVLRRVAEYARRHHGGLRLVFGLDANSYERVKQAGKQLDVREFNRVFRDELALTSCFGDEVDPSNYTTFNARTHLQPQLNKAAGGTKEDFLAKGDVNPKDFVLTFAQHGAFRETRKDNTGKGGVYVEDMVFPTLSFPSDHGLVSTLLVWNKSEL